jgi:hypothetical protein
MDNMDNHKSIPHQVGVQTPCRKVLYGELRQHLGARSAAGISRPRK